MKFRSMLLATYAIGVIAVPFAARAADGCDDYPLSDGLSVQDTERGPKIMSTATAEVNFDDAGDVLDSTKEAELMAKASIAKFLNETIQSNESLDKAIETQVKIVGDQKIASKIELKKQLTSIKDSASALLKGVVKIGDCYTKGKLVRVTVGIKPETIAAAQGGKKQIQGDDGAGSAIVSAPPTKQLSGVDGYNNSGGISKF